MDSRRRAADAAEAYLPNWCQVQDPTSCSFGVKGPERHLGTLKQARAQDQHITSPEFLVHQVGIPVYEFAILLENGQEIERGFHDMPNTLCLVLLIYL